MSCQEQGAATLIVISLYPRPVLLLFHPYQTTFQFSYKIILLLLSLSDNLKDSTQEHCHSQNLIRSELVCCDSGGSIVCGGAF